MTDLERRLAQHLVMPANGVLPSLSVRETGIGYEMSLTVGEGGWTWHRSELFYRIDDTHDVEAEMATALRHWNGKLAFAYATRDDGPEAA